MHKRPSISDEVPTYTNSRAIGEFGGVKMYSYRYENTTLVRDFVPAYRIADSAAGFVDILTNTWYGNAGTGPFVAGDFCIRFIIS